MTKNRPGRPSLDPSGLPAASIHLKLRAVEYDRIDRVARQQRMSIQDVIRRNLRHLLHDQRGGTL